MQFLHVYLPKTALGITCYVVAAGGVMLSVFYLFHGPGGIEVRIPASAVLGGVSLFGAYLANDAELT